MDLKTFISSTLTQIVEGVAEAQTAIAAGGTNARVNLSERGAHMSPKDYGASHPVDFDVAITVTEEGVNGVQGGLKVAGILNFGGEAKETSGSESVSRVRFQVQLAQPSSIEVVRSVR